MMVHILKGALLFSALYLMAGLASAQLPSRTPLKPGDTKLIAYSKSFAKRFALPDPAVGFETADGMQAVEFQLELGKTVPIYFCVLKIYIDSELPVAFPEESVGGAHQNVSLREHFFLWPNRDGKRWQALSVEDREHFSSRDGRYRLNAGLASHELQRNKGFFEDLQYESFYRDLFKGVTYIKLIGGCSSYVNSEKAGVIQLWIKRVGGRDYRRSTAFPVSDDFLKFSFPSTLYRRIIDMAKEANRYNNGVDASKSN